MSKIFPFTGGVLRDGVPPHPRLRYPPPLGHGMGYPPRWGTPHPRLGYPPDMGWGTPRHGMGYPPSKVGLGTPPSQDWIGYPPMQGCIGYPPPRLDQVPPLPKCGQTENITSCHPLDAGGNQNRQNMLTFLGFTAQHHQRVSKHSSGTTQTRQSVRTSLVQLTLNCMSK